MISKRKASPCCVDFDGGGVISLHDDVLMGILMLLPVKSVIRLQLVCKWWLSLISADQFRRLHTLCRRHRPKPPPSLLLATRHWLFYPKEVLFNFNPIIGRLSLIPFSIGNSIILSSSNGLMLLLCLDDRCHYLYNPITKESKKLSHPHNVEFLNPHLLFDPSKSLHYEIVSLRIEKGYHQIQVFNSETGIWRVCEEPITMLTGILKFDSCRRYKRLIYLTCCFGRIICFDTVKNIWHIVDCPVRNGNVYAIYSHSFQESNGHLYYCTLFHDRLGKPTAALWEVRVDEDDPRRSEWWLLKYDNIGNILPDCWTSELLTFIAETSTMLIRRPRKIMAYNFGDQSYKEILDLEPRVSYVRFDQFVETLALL